MRKILLMLVFLFLTSIPSYAQEKIYLPVLFKDNCMTCEPNAILRLRDENNRIVDIIGPNSGWKLADPKWKPSVPQFKGGGSMVDSSQAEGQGLTDYQYGNAIETIPLTIVASKPDRAIQTLRNMLQLLKQASDYHTRPYEYSQVWIEAKPTGENFLVGYGEMIKGSIPEYTAWDQPFLDNGLNNASIMEDITLVVERKPFWRITKPGEIIGPLYNLIKNPDFELWNFGVVDSEPDSWNNVETLWISGTNSRQQTGIKWGQSALKINVSGSTKAGAAKGISQVLNSTVDGTEYTILAWVRSDGVSNGVGRILITYSDQLELYRENESHGWKLYVGKITLGTGDVVGVTCEILATSPNTDGTFYVDGMMFIEGDWEEEAKNNLLPYLSSSHIVNHWDQPSGNIEAGDINFVDVWNVPGDVDSLIRLEIQNNTVPANQQSPIELYSTIRAGLRRTNNIFNFNNYNDPTGDNDATASSDNRVTSPNLNSSWIDITSKIINGTVNTRDNFGKYRVFARVYDPQATGDSTLKTRLRYFIGTGGVNEKILDQVSTPIINNWSVVDLTQNKSLNFLANKAIPIGQLGYKIQANRPTGTDVARLDYVLVLPTDGGFLKARIEPPLTYGNMLVADGTINNVNISATNRKANQWLTILNTGETLVSDIAEFNGDIYFACNGKIVQLKNGVFTDVLVSTDPGAAGVFGTVRHSLVVWNNKLYATKHEDVGANRLDIQLYVTENGVNWTYVDDVVTNEVSTAEIIDMIIFNNTIFIAYNEGFGSIDARVYTSDGNTVVLNILFPGVLERSSNFEIYSNNLYITVEQDLYRYDIPTNNWVVELDIGVISWAIKEFNGYLYISSIADIYRYDGDNIELVEAAIGIDNIRKLEVYNGKIWACGTTGAATNNPLAFSEDGETWELATLNATSLLAMGQGNGILYLGEYLAADINAEIFSFSDFDNTYSVSDYEGGKFLAPPRTFDNPKRHRYFFSYDRENFINNLDDKALIGVGFVPRYLTLVNEESIILGN